MNFEVNIDFRKGPSFSTQVDADDKQDAEEKAMTFARANGFDGAAKKITVRLT